MKLIFPCLKIDIERWKYNSQYQVYVSTHGRVKDNQKHLKRVLTNQKGYLAVEVMGGIKLLHRLVMETWCICDNYENLTIDHLDHNKRNNRVDNLEWVTQEENLKRAKEDKAREGAIIDTEIDIEDIDRSFAVANGQLVGTNLKTPIIKCGNNLFYTYEEAIQFLISKKKVLPDCNKDTVRKGIINSIISKTKYCKYTFELR